MKPVQEILKIDAGLDFEKCTRCNTAVTCLALRCTPPSAFWMRRKFDVLLVAAKDYDAVYWGLVVQWLEFNMGAREIDS
jgi:hypothetical protein